MIDSPEGKGKIKTSTNNLTDRQIVKLVQEGERRYYEVLLRRYNQQLYRVVRSYIQSNEQIKDVLQSAYIKAYEHLEDFEGRSSISTWLTRIAINEALQCINTNKRFVELPEDLNGELSTSSVTNNQERPDHQVTWSQIQGMLEKKIDRLPLKYRVVFVMREIEGMSTKVTADTLEISRSTVKVRLHRAKKKIREQLDRDMPEAEVYPFGGNECDEITKSVMNALKTVAE